MFPLFRRYRAFPLLASLLALNVSAAPVYEGGSASAEPPPSKALNIWCIGDSITQGHFWTTKYQPWTNEYSYRWDLQKKLHEAGINYDFIGSRTKGFDPRKEWPEIAPGKPFDPQHDGYWGEKTGAVLSKAKVVLPTLATPDVVLIHLGTNDQKSAKETPEQFLERVHTTVTVPLEDIVTTLRARNPEVKIILGQPALRGGQVQPIKDAIAGIANRLGLTTIDHLDGWSESPPSSAPSADPSHYASHDTYDWVHPAPRGREKMASKWFAAIANKKR